jgi:hypothetical protein
LPSRRSDRNDLPAPGQLLYHLRRPSIGPQPVDERPDDAGTYVNTRRWAAAVGGALWASRYAVLAILVLALTLTSGQGLEALRFVHEANNPGGIGNGYMAAAGALVLGLVIHLHTLCMLVGRARVLQGEARTQACVQLVSRLERQIAGVLSALPAVVFGATTYVALGELSDAWLAVTLIMCVVYGCVAGVAPAYFLVKELVKPVKHACICVAVFALAIVLFAAVAAFGQSYAEISSPFVVAVGIASLLSLHGLLTLVALTWSIPIPAVAGIAALCALAVQADQYAVLRGSVQPAHAWLARDAFAQWVATRPDRRDYQTYPVFIVAAEGGGARAAHLTAYVLSRLAQANPNFKQHLLAVVGVSGGSVGATMWSLGAAPELPPSRCGPANLRRRLTPESVVVDPSARAAGALRTDLLTPVFHSLFGADLMEQLTGARTEPRDRATALEDALEDAWQETGGGALRGVCFSDLWSPAELNRPALILLGTDSRTGQRVAASHLLLSSLGQIEHRPPAAWQRGAVLRTLAQERPWSDPPILSAAFMSARFPVVSPGARLKAGAGAVVVDGGYFENSGVTTVLELLDAIDRPDIRPIVIRIENGGADGDTDGGWFNALIPQPALALYQTRGSRAAIAVEALRKRLPAEQRALFSVQTPKAKIPLGWAIWARARNELDAQVEAAHNATAFQIVRSALVSDRRQVKR